MQRQVYSDRPVNADKSSVERDTCELDACAGSFPWTTEVLGIPSDENPILGEQNLFEFLVLPAGLANPNDMRRLMVTAFAGHQGKLRTQAFVDEEFRHAVAGTRRFFRCVRTTAWAGRAARGRGRPRCGLASAYIAAKSTCSRCRLG